MDSEQPASSRYLSCNGPVIRDRRLSRGWTQDELARLAGYSRRLVQKAESGGSLTPSTLAVLAETLSNESEPVSIELLTVTPLSVVQEFVLLFNERPNEVAELTDSLIHDDVVFWSAGDPTQFPFGGEFQGRDGAREFWKRFFGTLTPSPDGILQKVSYLANGPMVVLWAEAHGRVAGMEETPTVWSTQRYEVRDGKIARFENHFDTQVGVEHLAEARARQLLDSND